MRPAASALALWLAVALGAPPAGQPVVRAVITPAAVPLGGRCDYCLTVVIPGVQQPQVAVQPPPFGPGLVPVGARFSSLRRVGPQWQQTTCWTLQAARRGRQQVGPATLAVTSAPWDGQPLPCPAAAVTVGPADPHSTGERPFPTALALALALTVLASALAAVLLIRGGEPVAADPPVVGLDQPEGRAMSTVQDARAAVLGEHVEAAYVKLAAGLYTYLAECAGRAANLTTAEALALLATLRLDDAARETLAASLRRCDAVRFAGERPPREESLALLATLDAALTTLGKGRRVGPRKGPVDR
ncbi:MAG: hypothetical protein IT204_18825 [Fimbriimonadaceae bacterium]|nr:hypothetical protein [Fimbriimonadaceae bacterium]